MSICTSCGFQQDSCPICGGDMADTSDGWCVLKAERDALLDQNAALRTALEEAQSWIRSAAKFYQIDLPDDDNCLNVVWRMKRALSQPATPEPPGGHPIGRRNCYGRTTSTGTGTGAGDTPTGLSPAERNGGRQG